MNNNIMKYLYVSCILFSSLYISCYKQDANKYSRSNVNLSFSIKEHSKGIVLSWEQTNISSFVEYIVTKSSESKAAVENLSDLDSKLIFARIKDRNINSLIDSTLAFNSYYRLYINQGEQLIFTEEILREPNNYVLTSSSVNELLVDYRKGNIYFLNSDQSVEFVDLDKLELINIYRNLSIPSPLYCSLAYDNDGNTEIYVPFEDKIRVIDGENFTIKRSITNINFQTPIYNTVTDEKNNLYYTDAIGGALDGIYKVHSDTKKITKFNVCATCNHLFFKMSKNGKRGLFAAPAGGLIYFTLNDMDQIDMTINSVYTTSWMSDQLFVIAENSQTLICGNTGSIFDHQFRLIKQLAIDVPGYVQSIFDDEEKYIYSIGKIAKEIINFENKPGYQKLGNIVIKSTPMQIFIYKGSIFVLGSVFDPSTRMVKLILEEVKL